MKLSLQQVTPTAGFRNLCFALTVLIVGVVQVALVAQPAISFSAAPSFAVQQQNHHYVAMGDVLMREKLAYDRLLERHQNEQGEVVDSILQKIEKQMEQRSVLIDRLECEIKSTLKATCRALGVEKDAFSRAEGRSSTYAKALDEMKCREPLVLRLESEYTILQDIVKKIDSVEEETAAEEIEEIERSSIKTFMESINAKRRKIIKKASFVNKFKTATVSEVTTTVTDADTVFEEAETEEVEAAASAVLMMNKSQESERKQRSLLTARLEMEQLAMKNKRNVQERQQRALLISRLEMEKKAIESNRSVKQRISAHSRKLKLFLQVLKTKVRYNVERQMKQYFIGLQYLLKKYQQKQQKLTSMITSEEEATPQEA